MRQPGRPFISLDLDGVICRPPLGFNIAIGRSLRSQPLPAALAAGGGTPPYPRSNLLPFAVELLRAVGRRPMPDATAGLRAIAGMRRLALVTGRAAVGRTLLEHWLARYGLLALFDQVLLNGTALPSAQYKLWTARSLGFREHVDDDGATTYYLATNGTPHVVLRDWPGNRGLPYPPNVAMVRSLEELPDLLALWDRAGT